MTAIGATFLGLWLLFFVVWLAGAARVKPSARGVTGRVVFRVLLLVATVLLVREWFVGSGRHAPHIAIGVSPIAIGGAAACAIGIGIAIWARIYLGRNWGTPMSLRVEHELVTTGPYAFVRHPIYFGILLALAGTALAVGNWWGVLLALLFAYFVYAARAEERLMAAHFPAEYSAYARRTKMLIPFVF